VKEANTIIKQVNSRLRFMYGKANCLSSETRSTLSMALIPCHFDYSCSCMVVYLKLWKTNYKWHKIKQFVFI